MPKAPPDDLDIPAAPAPKRRAIAAPLAEDLLSLVDALGKPIVGFDSAGPEAVLCIAGLRPGDCYEIVLPSAAMPSEALTAQLALALEAAGRTAAELGALVVGVGPGSFTGVRVALALAKGLALGAPIPVYGVSSLALLCAGAAASTDGRPGRAATVIAAVDARRDEWFFAAYDLDERGRFEALIDDTVGTAAQLRAAVAAVTGRAPRSFIGDKADAAATVLGQGHVVHGAPSVAAGIVHLAGRIRAGADDDIAVLTPRYLRLSEPERKLEG